MNLADLKANFLKSPKTTITGACGAAIAIILAVMALPPKASAPVIAIAVLRALIDFSKQDAGTTLAIPPGSNTPQQVPSHEVPDNPQDKPVPKIQ
jgi:hypothetical protein